MPRPFPRLLLSKLETRLAPATWVDSKTLTFQDIDGDAATISFSRPVLTQDNANSIFTFNTGSVNQSDGQPQQLQTIDLSALPNRVAIAALAVAANGGDGRVNVGWIKGDGRDVGAVTIAGDLGRVTAGNVKPKGTGLKWLTVDSIGVLGTSTQASGGNLHSIVHGSLGKITVGNSVNSARIQVNGGTSARIGGISIGGSLLADATDPQTGWIDTTGSVGVVSIGGNIDGGTGDHSGISAGGSIGNVFVGGSLLGDGPQSASIQAGTKIGSVQIIGSMLGGSGFRSAAIVAAHGAIGHVDIGANVSGVGEQSASIQSLVYNTPGGAVTGGKIASLTIGGNVTGGIGIASGSISAFKFGRVEIAGDIVGGSGSMSASLDVFSNAGPMIVKSLTGGNGSGSGAIRGGKIASVLVQGDVTGNVGPSSGAILAEQLGPITITGNLAGGGGDGSAAINAGKIASITISGDAIGGVGIGSAGIDAPISLGSVSVRALKGGAGPDSASIHGGRIRSVALAEGVIGGTGDRSAAISAIVKVGTVNVVGDVIGGVGRGSGSLFAGKTLGKITVGGDWVGASIVAGFSAGADGFFNTGDDVVLNAKGSISGISVGGTIHGTAGVGDSFAFLAANVKALKVSGNPVALSPKPKNDDFAVGATGDFRVVER